MKLDRYLIVYPKVNSKCIKDLNIRPETVKLLKVYTGGKLLDIGLGDNILDLIPKTKSTKAKMNKNYFKLKILCRKKGNKMKMNRPPMEWEKILKNQRSDKELIKIILKTHMNQQGEKTSV